MVHSFPTRRSSDLVQLKASTQHFDNSAWGIVRIFHTFSGSRFNAPSSERDWPLTTIWVVAMDAVAAGLVAMVFGGYYMWYRLKRSHALGWTALLAGAGSCALFLRGLFLG